MLRTVEAVVGGAEEDDIVEEEEPIDNDEQVGSECEFQSEKSTVNQLTYTSKYNIVQLKAKVIRGENKHVWTTVKPKSLAMQATTNTVHKVQELTHKSKYITEPMACF